MKKVSILSLTLISLSLFSCAKNNDSSKYVHIYEPFGCLTSEQVEEFSKSYCRRIGMEEIDAPCVSFEYDLGKYGDNTYVDIVRFEKEGIGGLTVIRSAYVHETYICDLFDSLYSINVWVEGDQSYGIESAYDSGKLTDDDINSIIIKAEERGLRRYGPQDK